MHGIKSAKLAISKVASKNNFALLPDFTVIVLGCSKNNYKKLHLNFLIFFYMFWKDFDHKVKKTLTRQGL